MTPQHKDSRSTRRVLVIFPGALGDLMCLMPALAAISRRHPGASIELMARFELAMLAAGRTVVARGHSIDARAVGELFNDEISDGARRLFADFERIYSFFASDDERFRARLAAATDAEVSFHPFRPSGDGHVSAAYLLAIGEGALAEDAWLEPTTDDLAAAARVLRESNVDTSNLIVIFPGSGSPSKNWPADKFAELATALRTRQAHLTPNPFPCGKGNRSQKVTVSQKDKERSGDDKQSSSVVILGPAEESLEPIFRDCGVPVLKDLGLPVVAAIARLATRFVGNDSGVSHLAAAVGAAGVVIFGPTDPARWRPLGRRIDILRREPIDSIEVEEVAVGRASLPAMGLSGGQGRPPH
ncbi:MAG TPA: glycosyltransferase family 9 protein [Candidatus Acidoferrum sp.]|nr:glycosyltransferase family 9 protein [Candidatus Acidoferrum sp.]